LVTLTIDAQFRQKRFFFVIKEQYRQLGFCQRTVSDQPDLDGIILLHCQIRMQVIVLWTSFDERSMSTNANVRRSSPTEVVVFFIDDLCAFIIN
jgi:hypothetical protein